MAPTAEVARPTAVPQAPDAVPVTKQAGGNTAEPWRKGQLINEPLKVSGALDSQHESFEVTPVIGREYPKLQLRDLINAPNADELIRDLAITSESLVSSHLIPANDTGTHPHLHICDLSFHRAVARRGVVFFRNQDITPEEQKALTDRLGRLTGKPAESTLHIHPVTNAERDSDHVPVDENGTPNKDNEISVISSRLRRDLYVGFRTNAKREWHSDITFEPVSS